MKVEKLFIKLFSLVGSPDAEGARQIEQAKSDCCRRRSDTELCYVYDVRPGHGFVWEENVDKVLGVEKLNLERFRASIHPEFVDVFAIYCRATYECIVGLPPSLMMNGEFTFNCNVPFRRASGEYYWYKMTSRPVAFDESGQLVCHFNQHYPLAPYQKMMPEPPEITVHGLLHPPSSEFLSHKANKYFDVMLQEKLSTGGYRLLTAYRNQTVASGGSWSVPAKSAVAATLGVSTGGLDRAISRLLRDVRLFYPSHAVRNIADLVVQLNQLFGHPQSSRFAGS